MARFFRSIRRPVYRPRPRTVGYLTASSSTSLTLRCETLMLTTTTLSANFGTQIGLFESAAYTLNSVATTINLDAKLGVAVGAFTGAYNSGNFDRQIALATTAFTTATPGNAYGLKFGLNPTAFTLAGTDVNFFSVSHRKTFGYIYR